MTNERKKGATLVLMMLLLALVVLPVIGLAIDGGLAFLIRTRLSAAADAAALAAARSLSVGQDAASQQVSATAVADSYIAANFPAGVYGSSAPTSSVAVDQTQSAVRTVTVQLQVTTPTYFLRIIGQNNSTIGASAQSTRRDVNLILVLDRSSSMANAGVCGTMKASAQNFVAKFANGRDTLGLVTFMSGAAVDYAPTTNFKSGSPSLNTLLGNLACGGNTASALGLWNAYNQIKVINQPGALNIIVFFTDGQPNGISADFPVKTAADTRYDNGSTATQRGVAASTCPAVPSLSGVIAQWANSQLTGTTAGPMSSLDGAINSTATPGTSPAGCQSASTLANMSRDVAYIPPVDNLAPGNATLGTGYPTADATDYFTSGPYLNQLRPDKPWSVIRASTTAADEQSKKITGDANYNIITFTVGLGGTDFLPIDAVFLNRIANSPLSTRFDSTRPNGSYVYAPTATDLGAAFNEIASQVLRLAK